MSIIVLQAALAGYAVIAFAAALRMHSRATVVTMSFPHEHDTRDSAGPHRGNAALV
ncbi:MAG: hypothetical protein ACR2JD_09310 [Nocardioides sp.]